MQKQIPSSDLELHPVSRASLRFPQRQASYSRDSLADLLPHKGLDNQHLLEPSVTAISSGSAGLDVTRNEKSLEFPDQPESKHHIRRRWTSYNPFTRRRREVLRRKLLSSGSAYSPQRLPGDSIDSEPDTSEKLAGWRKGTWVCCGAVMVCIVIEFSLLIWAADTSIHGSIPGLIYRGNCDRTKSLAIWLLLPLNIAATVLIGSSNYVMQVMTAPSRSEIDEAHQKAQSLVIGGLSVFHRSYTNRDRQARRLIRWVLIGSSLPIHLLLNSAIYSSVQGVDVGVLVVSDEFEADPVWDKCTELFEVESWATTFACGLMQNFTQGETVRMSPSQCISQYANSFQANASNVIVVTAADAPSWYCPPYTSPAHACGRLCDANWTQVPEAECSSEFRFWEVTGEVDVFPPFNLSGTDVSKFCSAFTNPDEPYYVVWTNTSSVYTTSEALFHPPQDQLSNITSIRSVFNAIDYRYWAIVNVTGDYGNKDDQMLKWTTWDTTSWMCSADDLASSRGCDPSELLAQSDWRITPSDLPVVECHVLPMEQLCGLYYSWKILVITICCDVVKLVAMILALRRISKPLTTLGDVIASFLEEPDPCTTTCGLLDDDEARKWVAYWQAKREALARSRWRIRLGYQHPNEEYETLCRQFNIPTGVFESDSQWREDSWNWLDHDGSWWATTLPTRELTPWLPHNKRWFAVLSKPCWLVFTVLYLGLKISAIIYLIFCIKTLQEKHLSKLWGAGFNGPDPNALWRGGPMANTTNIIWVAAIINFPQVFFSLLYFLFNSILTSMHTCREWSDFTQHRKPLRVSYPKGSQRSTYWLQLPWSYSIPLITASGLLHWLLGRSIYLIKFEGYTYYDKVYSEETIAHQWFACGYSPITALILVVVMLCMGTALLIISFRRIGSGSPLVKFNSLAISAACHPHPSEKDVALHPLMWGVVRDENGVDTQHCSFSSREVSPLKEGMIYT